MVWSSHVFTVKMRFCAKSEKYNPFTKLVDWRLELEQERQCSLYFKPTCSIFIESLEPKSDSSSFKYPNSITQGPDWIKVAHYNVLTFDSQNEVTIQYRVDIGWVSAKRLPNIAELLDDDETKDVLFKIGNENIRAHSQIICWRVPAFKAMFASGMKEAQTNCATIEDTEPNAFRHFLQFIYSGKMPMNESIDDVAAVLMLAEKYDLSELKEACVDILGWRLDKSSVVDIWILAQTYNCPDLEKLCEQRFHELKGTLDEQVWEKLKQHPDLMVNIIKRSKCRNCFLSA